MAFCTKCGVKLEDGTTHQCEVAASSEVYQVHQSTFEQQAQKETISVSIPNLNMNKGKILSLLKNPFSATTLSADPDFVYGLLGIVLNILGVLFIINSLISQLEKVLSSLSFFYPIRFDDFPIFRFVMVSIVTTVVLFGSVWFAGVVSGVKKYGFKQVFTVLGGTQWFTGALLIITGIFSYVANPLFTLFLVVTVSANSFIVAYVGINLFEVKDNHKVKYILIHLFSYAIASYFIIRIMISSAMNGL
jgi:hypothetical protein